MGLDDDLFREWPLQQQTDQGEPLLPRTQAPKRESQVIQSQEGLSSTDLLPLLRQRRLETRISYLKLYPRPTFEVGRRLVSQVQTWMWMRKRKRALYRTLQTQRFETSSSKWKRTRDSLTQRTDKTSRTLIYVQNTSLTSTRT